MKKLLIANRGEIAIRIARAARDYGIASVAIYSDADANSLHVELAEEAYGLGPGRPADTYLNIEKILDIAGRSGADAVHPGYGFLSERAEFAQAVIDAGLIWVGPAPDVISALGDKVEARRIAARVGAPLVKGSDGPLASAAEAVTFAKQNGVPLAIKAAFGGGGRGMKVAWTVEEVGELFESAVREAKEAFGRGECYAEQFLDKPRHIEAQVIADSHGNTVVLGTRDCSLQRRNQKLVEEAPAPFLTEDQRARIHDAAREICAEACYTGAGTVEFLLSGNGVISFLEVNTRLQVEHPVTEETSGVDIVIEQLRIADGLALSITETPAPRGHAFEFRINAEDAGRGFLPTPGLITRFRPPAGPGIRLDAGVESGSEIPSLYDSMMAKLIVTGTTRQEALVRARRALAEFQIEGVASVLPFHRAVLEEPDFTGEAGFKVYTNWIETAFRGIEPAPRVDPVEGGLIRSFIEIDGKRHTIGLPTALFSGLAAPQTESVSANPASANAVTAPIPGTLQKWLVEDGAQVAGGEAVALIEAMKMEMRVLAPKAGRVCITVNPGITVAMGAELATIIDGQT
ncbi:ATP-grasp domain-containing protein [Sinorhizobium meliloti]|uniref:acetyl/propionyl/methylcrotonyl-CoA carboxylase subunit alpha n=1 Tax=Rhizobium meliloti TaxID=382 RepID=UPI000FD945F0|nr:biotin carboxylase N-terminal domain-containing protein [Sinorhizobium meliloti]RVG22109.1 ATP-grasp domain-containing protein [Sinorhizobium meliloti]RVL00691.1 ATP-grasp domain-containing protein [Sinorhizobium meliloti]RVN46426.1 ATP-grasp domain-containing protein [Sinorhizobium meliloti]